MISTRIRNHIEWRRKKRKRARVTSQLVRSMESTAGPGSRRATERRQRTLRGCAGRAEPRGRKQRPRRRRWRRRSERSLPGKMKDEEWWLQRSKLVSTSSIFSYTKRQRNHINAFSDGLIDNDWLINMQLLNLSGIDRSERLKTVKE